MVLYAKVAAGSLGHTKQFCQELTDYCAYGHFCIYEQVLTPTSEHYLYYKKLIKLSQLCCDISDDLVKQSTRHDQNFRQKMSLLGEAMGEQFELEDEVLQSINPSVRGIAAC